MKFTLELKWLQPVAGHSHADIHMTLYAVNSESFATIETVINKELGKLMKRAYGWKGYEPKTVEIALYDATNYIGNANRKPLATYLLKKEGENFTGYIMRANNPMSYGAGDRATFIADTLRILRIRCGVDTVDESSFYASLSK